MLLLLLYDRSDLSCSCIAKDNSSCEIRLFFHASGSEATSCGLVPDRPVRIQSPPKNDVSLEEHSGRGHQRPLDCFSPFVAAKLFVKAFFKQPRNRPATLQLPFHTFHTSCTNSKCRWTKIWMLMISSYLGSCLCFANLAELRWKAFLSFGWLVISSKWMCSPPMTFVN